AGEGSSVLLRAVRGEGCLSRQTPHPFEVVGIPLCPLPQGERVQEATAALARISTSRGPIMPFSTYLPEHMGSIRLSPSRPLAAAGSADLPLTDPPACLAFVYPGMLKASCSTPSDMGKPQSAKPAAPNFTTVEASNGAKLDVWFDRLNIRPYANTLL